MSSEEITKLVAETCAYLAIVHPDYTMLANRVSVDALHKRTSSDIREVAQTLFSFKDKAGRPAPLLCERTFGNIMKHADAINQKIDYSRDYNYDFFGFKTLEKSYLLRVEGKIAERP